MPRYGVDTDRATRLAPPLQALADEGRSAATAVRRADAAATGSASLGAAVEAYIVEVSARLRVLADEAEALDRRLVGAMTVYDATESAVAGTGR